MTRIKHKITVASVQASPILPMNKNKTIDKACDLIGQAGKEKADIIVFPETFIPMYPNFSIDLSNPNEWRRNLMELTEHSIYADGEEIKKLAKSAKDAGAFVVMGINERVGSANEGNILGIRRKLFPSNREKAFWHYGDGKDICVFDTNIGKIGGLICYEHLQPLLKYAHMSLGEQIHCASWPGWPLIKDGRSNKHVIDASARQYALEGQCFVIISCMYVSPENIPDSYFGNASWTFFGGSGIVGPDGEYIAGPVYDREDIIYAEINLRDILMRKTLIDTVGRDTRRDVFNFSWNNK